MKRQHVVTSAILWAVAILASALLGAPKALCLIVLPPLAALWKRTRCSEIGLERSN